jgi:hypothetical protein
MIPSPTMGTGVRWPILRQLAWIEGTRLARHPAYLAGLGLALAGSAIFVATTWSRPANWSDDGWTLYAGFALLAPLTMVATNFVTLRDRRSHTVEQHNCLPAALPTRTGGVLAGLAVPVAIAGALLGVVIAYGARIAPLSNLDTLHVVALVPMMIMLGALGVALARWLPNPFITPILALLLYFSSPGDDPPPWRLLMPFTAPPQIQAAQWHVVYLIGLAVIFGAAAMAHVHRVRTVAAAGLFGAVITIAAAWSMLA